MTVLIFSDIHGNLPAFEEMLKNEPDVEHYVSLGDVVNYGPWSNECVDLLESLNAVRLRGNHEEYFMAGRYPGTSQLVKTFFEITTQKFSRMSQIANYQEKHVIGNYTCRHTIDNAYVYPDTIIEAMGNYFIGHSHYQFDRKGNNYHVINVGSVGQNRKEINVINYAIFDNGNNNINLKSLVYDIQPVIAKMRALNYPAACIDYYKKKLLRK